MPPVESPQVKKRLKALKTTLDLYLSPGQKEIVLKRAFQLLQESYVLKGVQALVKDIIKSRDDRNNFFNHLVELNLVYLFSEVKKRAVGIERKVRPDSNKRVDMVLPGKRVFYIEVKNINDPELPWLKEKFCNVMGQKLRGLGKGYFVNFLFFRPARLSLSEEEMEEVLGRIKKTTGLTVSSSLFYYPSQTNPTLAFSLERCEGLSRLEVGRYGYGGHWQYNLYSERYLEVEIDKELGALKNPSIKAEEKRGHERNLRRYRLLKENSAFLEELELKQSLLRGIKDAEMKFPSPEEDSVNILLIHYGWQGPRLAGENLARDVVGWYYFEVADRGRPGDRWRNYYDIWAEEEGFKREKRIDAFVIFWGTGVEDAYQWKIIFSRKAEEEIKELLS
ncbi:MAG TPA: hypothetical protein ACFYD1_01405 [Candidatus Hypogeohydataceae bacterium YC38]